MSAETNDDLRKLVQKLASENAELQTQLKASPATDTVEPVKVSRPRRTAWGWGLLSTVLIVIGALLAPVAIIGNWAERQLTDTETFVATFAPLAQDPAVQAYISDEVSAAINEKLDTKELTSNLFDGIAGLGLKPQAEAALRALEAPAALAVDSLLEKTVDRLVESPQFATLFERTLRTSHEQMIATLQSAPDALVEIGAEGEIGIQLRPIIASVKEALVAQGIGIAAQIPEVDRTVVVATADAAVSAKTSYTLAVTLGPILPWAALIFLVAGVIVARSRSRALIGAALALALSATLAYAGISIARPIVINALSPSVMPADAAGVAYEAIVSMVASTAVAVAVLAATVAIATWIAGPFRLPQLLRAGSARVAERIRATGDTHHVSTGAFGEWLYRMRALLRWAVALGAAAIVVFVRPLTPGVIIWTAVLSLLVILIMGLLQRPTRAEPVTVGGAPQ